MTGTLSVRAICADRVGCFINPAGEFPLTYGRELIDGDWECSASGETPVSAYHVAIRGFPLRR